MTDSSTKHPLKPQADFFGIRLNMMRKLLGQKQLFTLGYRSRILLTHNQKYHLFILSLVPQLKHVKNFTGIICLNDN